jgi:hypothetical protein
MLRVLFDAQRRLKPFVNKIVLRQNAFFAVYFKCSMLIGLFVTGWDRFIPLGCDEWIFNRRVLLTRHCGIVQYCTVKGMVGTERRREFSVVPSGRRIKS